MLQFNCKSKVTERKFIEKIFKSDDFILKFIFCYKHLREFCICSFRNLSAFSCYAVKGIVMEKHCNSVFSDMDICFNSVCTHIHAGVKSEECVFRQVFTCAAVCIVYKMSFAFLINDLPKIFFNLIKKGSPSCFIYKRIYIRGKAFFIIPKGVILPGMVSDENINVLIPEAVDTFEKLTSRQGIQPFAFKKVLFQLVCSCTAEHSCTVEFSVLFKIKKERNRTFCMPRSFKAKNLGISELYNIAVAYIKIRSEATFKIAYILAV